VEVLERPGRRAVVLVSRDELVVIESVVEAGGGGAGPHFHKHHVDSFYVLEGELAVTVAGEEILARPGKLVHAAPTVVHSFENASGERVRFLNVHAPGMRFDEYMRRMDAGEDVDHEEYDAFEVEE
jgi:mannose-6-phosphate isomerase-like protein (cupin superfamily)